MRNSRCDRYGGGNPGLGVEPIRFDALAFKPVGHFRKNLFANRFVVQIVPAIQPRRKRRDPTRPLAELFCPRWASQLVVGSMHK